MLPEHYRNAIENVQPFQRLGNNETPDQDLLLLLRDLNNQDKHHLQVQPLVSPSEITHKFAVQFETEADAAMSVPPDTTLYADAHFVDGACLMRNRTKGRIASVQGGCDIRAQVIVIPPDRGPEGATDVLSMLCLYTGSVLEYLSSTQP